MATVPRNIALATRYLLATRVLRRIVRAGLVYAIPVTGYLAGMHSGDLTREQAAKLHERVRPMFSYLELFPEPTLIGNRLAS